MTVDAKILYSEINKYIEKRQFFKDGLEIIENKRNLVLLDFNDGTCFKSIQIVYDNKLADFLEIPKNWCWEAAIEVVGKVISSPAKGQEFEVQATKILVIGESGEDYPIQPKRHSREFLREQLI